MPGASQDKGFPVLAPSLRYSSYIVLRYSKVMVFLQKCATVDESGIAPLQDNLYSEISLK